MTLCLVRRPREITNEMELLANYHSLMKEREELTESLQKAKKSLENYKNFSYEIESSIRKIRGDLHNMQHSFDYKTKKDIVNSTIEIADRVISNMINFQISEI